MKLVIEDSDFAKVGLHAGEYDLDDLNAVKVAKMLAAAPGSHAEIEIELRLHNGMKPEPGSIGEPHYKFGVAVTPNVQYQTRDIVVFARAEKLDGAPALGFKGHVDDRDLHVAQDPYKHVEEIVRKGVEVVAKEIVEVLAARAADAVMAGGYGTKKAQGLPPVTPQQKAQDQFFGLPTKKKTTTCDECGESGEYTSPATGAVSDCSKGCPKS